MIARVLFLLVSLSFLAANGYAGAPSFHYLEIGGGNSSGPTVGTASRFSADGSVLIGRPGSGSALGNIGFKAVLGAGAPVLSRFDDFTPADVSADGSVLVGGTSNAFRKTGTTLTTLTPAGFARASAASVSADGSVVAGSAIQQIGGLDQPARPFRWTAGTGTKVFDLQEDTAVSSTVTIAKDGASLFAITVYSPPALSGISYTYGISRWDAAGARTEIVPPVGYAFTRFGPQFSLSANGAAAMLIQERARLSPYLATAVFLWTPQGSSIIPLPKLFGHDEVWTGVLQSADGSVFVAWSPRNAVRYANGAFTDLGPVTPRFIDADGSVILGTLNANTHPAAWTAPSGLVDVSEKLGLQVDSPLVPSGRWSLASFGVHGSSVVFVANGNPVATVPDTRISVGELSVASLAAPEQFTGTLLTEGTRTKPSATYSENAAVRAVNRGGPPPAAYGPVRSGSAKLRITMSMEGVDLNSLTAGSPVELFLGSLRIFEGTLNDDTSSGGFSPGDTSAEFGNAGLKIQWTPQAVSFEVKRASLLSEYGRASGTLPIRLRFGERSGLRMLQFSGKFSRDFNNGGSSSSFFTSSFSSKGAFAPVKPAVTAAVPKDGSSFSNRHLQLPQLVSKTLVEIWMRLNVGDWTYLGTGTVTPPPILLTEGANSVEFEARDGLGNTTTLFKRNYSYLPKTGSYTTLLSIADEARGYITLLLTEDGAFTGKLNLDGKLFPLRGALDAAGHATLQIGRGVKLEALGLTLDLLPGAEANALDAALTIPQTGAAALLATGTGGRAVWNAPLHPALLAGTPQERLPANFAALLQPGAGAPAVVPGSGHCGLRLIKGSIITVRGKLADGTPFTASLPLDDTLTAPVFLRLAGGKIRLGGTLTFDFSQPATDFTGRLRWQRDPAVKGAFAAGWNFAVEVIGSRSGYLYDQTSPLFRFSGGGLATTLGFIPFTYPPDPLFSVKSLTWIEYSSLGYKGSFKDPASGKAYAYEALRLLKSGQFGGFFVTPAGGGTVELTGLNGTADGPGEVARFNVPTSLALDSEDNVYVTDRNNHTIRKVTSAGFVSTFAGRALYRGAVDGIGGNARFHSPSGIAVDTSDLVFVSDTQNHTIRRIAAGGTVSTFAGLAGQGGDTNGNGTNARFSSPGVLAFSGVDLYVGGNTLRKVTPGAAVTTINQSVSAMAAADGDGNLFFGKTARVQKIAAADGNVTNLAGNPALPGAKDGRGEAARFSYDLGGLAADAAGNVFAADTWNHTIRKIAPDGTVTTFAGKALSPGKSDGTGAAARFREPRGLAFDSVGNLYVADSLNHSIRKVTPAGEVTTFAGAR